MSNTGATNRFLTDEEMAFMASFKETHGQYELTDAMIISYLIEPGWCEYFDGCTQLADALNLWNDAIKFARRA
jgi:hypothetical protein